MKKPPTMILGAPLWLLQLWAVATLACGAWAYWGDTAAEFRFTMLTSGGFLVVIVILAWMGGFQPRLDRDAGIDRTGQGR